MKRMSLTVLVLLGLVLFLGCSKGSSSPTTIMTTTTTRTTSSSSSTTGTPPSASTSTTASFDASQSTTIGAGTYTARLSGAEVVPAVKTTATGLVTFTVAANGTALSYVLRVSGISDPIVARLHEGAAGASGSTLATLFGGPAKQGSFTGALASGTLKATSLGGPLTGKTLADLVTLIKAGKVYVLLGTTQHPSGEIRGQVK
jgi:hypothetical protein